MARSSISVLALAAVVLVLASFSSAFIVNNPTTTAVAAGSNAVFTATTSAGVWNFQWLFSINNGASYEIVPGATGATGAGGGAVTLTINNALRSYDGFLYLVQISNAAGDRFTSTAARLTIRKAPRILAQPADTLVDSGAPATFSVTAVAEETIVYAWDVSADQGLTWTPIVGATSATFTTGATTPAMLFRRYRVRLTTATFTAPVTSNEAVLRVAFVTITAQPASVTVPEGAQGSFSIAYTSFPAATVLWQASGAGAVFADVPGGSGAQSTTYTTVPTTFDMSGRTFQAVVSNGRVSVNSGPATLSVNKRIVILTQPVSVTLVEGSAATFVVTASGTSPLVYRWQVSSDNSASWTDVPLPAGGLPTLVLPTVSRTMNSLRYRVLVSTTDTLGTTTLISSTATLTVVYLPTILSQPARSVVVVNDLVTFGVLVDANPPATYVWQSSVRNDAAAIFANIAVDATGPSYRVRSTTLLDSTFYRVIVSNSQGSVTSDVVEVRVNHPRN